jgi:long-chain acyl-CoA synthetase
MIVSGGENIYSVEVERALSLHEAVCQVAVIGVPDNKWGEKIIAFVALAQGSVVSQDVLIKHCREHIAGYKIPKEIFIKDALPMNLTGKIQKNILRNPYWSGKTRKIS